MRKSLLLGLVILLSGCGKSPLFNHVRAEDQRASEPAPRPNACPLEFPKAGLCAAISWDVMPTGETEGSFTLRFWSKATGVAADPAQTVFVKLWMKMDNGHEHGSSPVTTTKKLSSPGNPIPGQYQANRVFFVMAGRWQIRVQLKQGATVVEEAIQFIDV